MDTVKFLYNGVDTVCFIGDAYIDDDRVINDQTACERGELSVEHTIWMIYNSIPLQHRFDIMLNCRANAPSTLSIYFEQNFEIFFSDMKNDIDSMSINNKTHYDITRINSSERKQEHYVLSPNKMVLLRWF